MTSEPTIIVAVQTLRSYNRSLTAMNRDATAIESWIARHAESNNRMSDFPKDACIGLLSHLGNPVYSATSITSEQQAWSGLMASAEQVLMEESNWIGRQSTQHNNTSYVRLFSSDITWIQQYAQQNSLPHLEWGNEYILNQLISDLRSCQGSGGAGSISHTILQYNPSNQP